VCKFKSGVFNLESHLRLLKVIKINISVKALTRSVFLAQFQNSKDLENEFRSAENSLLFSADPTWPPRDKGLLKMNETSKLIETLIISIIKSHIMLTWTAVSRGHAWINY